jgi:putative ABC transport system substrate-binding protein
MIPGEFFAAKIDGPPVSLGSFSCSDGRGYRGETMRRREFLILVAGVTATWPESLAGQTNGTVRRIGVLSELSNGDPQALSNIAALEKGLRKLGWWQGDNLRIDYRLASDDPVLVWKFAKELVESQPELIIAHSSPVVSTLRGETRDIPIIFVSISDPVGEGFVESFAHPGGNITGFTSVEAAMTGKWVELLKTVDPRLKRVGFLFNPQSTAGGGSYLLRPIDTAASVLGVKAVMALVHNDDEIEAAFVDLAREPATGAVLLPDLFTLAHYQLIVALAEQYRLPTVYSYRFMAEQGGLISYGANIDNLFERSATYVDRILRGAKPNELPVQAPTKFEVVINNKTAKTLGLVIPSTLLAIADDVIE